MADQPKAKRNTHGSAIVQPADLLLGRHDFLTPFAVGSWNPSVDICQTPNRISVRIELPGVDPSDIDLSYQGGNLRIQGIKREQPRELLCYYCLERRYGRFDRLIVINGVVNPRKSVAILDKGILTIELPLLKERRGDIVKIRIGRKND